MRKEYLLALTLGLFVFGQALDSLQGNVLIPISNPLDFSSSQILATYPFTAVSVGIKVLALVLTTYLFLSLISGAHLVKAIVLFVLAGLTELYAVQQFATKLFVLPVSWTLALAWAALAVLGLALLEVLLAFFSGVSQKLSDKPQETIWEENDES